MKTGFSHYTSIDNHYNRDVIDTIMNHELYDPNMQWSCSEKVHGANFSFHIEKQQDTFKIQCASRSGFLDEKRASKFYQAAPNVVLTKYREELIEVYNEIEREFPDCTIVRVAVYGELFGGIYDGKKAPNSSVIQRGVYYCPHNEFYPFDIHVKLMGDKPTETEGRYIDVDLFQQIMQKRMFSVYGKEVFRGTLLECLTQDVEINTTIPLLLGLPPLEKNIMEGYVIKPIRDVNTGFRWILKKKSDGFKEVCIGPPTSNPFISSSMRTVVPMKTEFGAKVMDEIAKYVTLNRLMNVQSKLPDSIVRKRTLIGKAVGLFTLDCLEEFQKEHSALWNSEELTKEEKKLVQKNISNLCSNSIKEYLKEETKNVLSDLL